MPGRDSLPADARLGATSRVIVDATSFEALSTLAPLVSETSFAPHGPTASDPEGEGGVGRRLRSPGRFRSTVDYLGIALLAFVPLLIPQPGVVTDDTKTYLYLDPGRYVRQAVSLWDPNIALGTVTHENIGYLLPMGPFYWVMAELHAPLWIAQRLWLGGLLFAAGAGMIYLCRTIHLSAPGCYVASIGFMFTPYVLQYAGRISVILMPWAGLPWMLAFVILALRRGGWRYPALFALVVALVSGINASSILYVGIGPALWLVYAVLVEREATWRKAWSVAWKVGLLSALVSLWWAIGLQVEAAYGVNILKYTETLPSTSSSSSPFEVLRGLGYWFFYGASDQTGNWTQAAVAYTQNLGLLALSFGIPVLAFLAAALMKWRQRAYFVLLVVVGMVLAVGPYPYYQPTAVSGLIKAFMGDTTAGLALRSTDRASPLVLLGLAVLLGAGVTAVYRRVKRTGLVVGAFALAAIAGASAPLWTSGGVVNGLTQPARPPAYVQEAADHLNSTHPGTRVYALPGNNFAAYRWGDTIDTVYPALLTRPFVTHEQQTMGSLPTADLLEAVDTPLQEGILDPSTLAPMASLMSAGDILVQYDQAYERYDAPDPQHVAKAFAVTPPGLSDPVSYGAPRPNVSTVAHFDEQALALPANQGWTAPLVSYTVDHPRAIVRAESLKAPLVVAGNSSGLVAASSFGLLSGNPTIFYAGTLDTNAKLKKKVLGAGANLVVTDSNRKQGYRWNGITDNAGYTETAAEGPDKSDPTDAPLDLFPKAPADAQSTTVFHGITSVTASPYGSPVQYFVEERPAAALDGNPQTAWLTAQSPDGQWWQVHFDGPRTAASVNLVQAQTTTPRQVITQVRLTFDGGSHVVADLGPASRTIAGQTIRFAPRTFSTLRITITRSVRTKYHVRAGYQNTAGFAEVRIPGVTADETVSMPQDLLRSAGSSSISHPLTMIMTRLRSSGYPPRSDPEPTLARTFWLPTARTFAVTGQARVSPLASDATIDQVVGRTGPTTLGPVASSSVRLTGDIGAGAGAAIDGNPATAWETGFGVGQQVGQWVQYALPTPVTFDTLDLKIVADGRHSVPTSVTVAAGGASEELTLPAIADGRVPGSVVNVPLTLPSALTGKTVRVTVESARIETTTDYATRTPSAMPIGIAEVGIPGVAASPVPVQIPSSCRDDLLAVDGAPIWVSVTGTSAAALARQPLTVSLCGPDAGGLALSAGNHTLLSTSGQTVGFDIDQLALSSSPGGGPAPVLAGGQLAAPTVTGAPSVTVDRQTATSMQLTVSGLSGSAPPFELVVGQSINAGWEATVGGHALGAPVLVDGFANGWTMDAAALGTAVHNGRLAVALRWTPQRRVNIALLISAMAILACLVLALVPLRRRRTGRRGRAIDAGVDPTTTAPGKRSELAIEGPELVTSLRPEAGRASIEVAFAWGIATGVVAGAIAAPLTGLVVGVATVIVMRIPKARLLLGLAATALVFAAGTYVTIHQGVDPAVPNGGWPVGFGAASGLAWAGVMFLGADATTEVVLGRLVYPKRETAAEPIGDRLEDADGT